MFSGILNRWDGGGAHWPIPCPTQCPVFCWVPHPYPWIQLPAVYGCFHIYFSHPDLFPGPYLQLPIDMSTQASCASDSTLTQILLYRCLPLPIAFRPVT